MDIDQYQEQAAQTAIYPGKDSIAGLTYTALGLAGEAGEISNKVKKILRDDNGVVTNEKRQDLIGELGDVLWYVAMVAEEIDWDLSSIANINLTKLKSRQHRGVLSGSGDNR